MLLPILMNLDFAASTPAAATAPAVIFGVPSRVPRIHAEGTGPRVDATLNRRRRGSRVT